MILSVDFVAEALANLLGVFVGVALALLLDRSARRRADRERGAAERAGFAAAREALLGSVLKNVAEARRLKRLLRSDADPLLLGIFPELSVWEATRSQFVAHATSVDDRVLFARFFDSVQRLDRTVSFYRGLAAASPSAAAPSVREKLAEIADDVVLGGTVIVTDHGDDRHKRLLGGAPPSA